ncbi:MAG: TIGR02391 family protein [Sulfuricurvum sp.]|uniref:TIGR02391 family protein n=1 Tax=Sulfuricurvum sp. TaxID=2025608 RepID=UPI00261510A0|nr:TIGR02391 family protein [Sulfuricurvum sp.]MDD2368138.1 TIGR02391 family protein [Sulfuricurvum sp.]MDD2950268.1 TIGR02391 family protein [Sulfuricurvum sp.]MDD5117837.1 TIGR02391 family protein [Sulfuricurvum sp.]
MANTEIEAKIEFQKVIGETSSGYKSVRFSRIKYKASPTTHIDIRQFQRGYDEEGEEQFFPTKTGFRIPEHEFRKVIEKYAVMPESYIHPLIVKKCFSLLQSGEFDSAVMQAFKAIEVITREKIGTSSDMFGERLLKKAFNPDDGILTNHKLPKSERSALLNYITGAFSFYRNSSSHRDIELDFVAAFDRIAVASDLLKIIEDAEISETSC